MTTTLATVLAPFFDVLPAMFIAMFGGLIAVLNSSEKQRSLSFIVSTLSSAAFVGLLMRLLTRHFQVGTDLASAIIAFSGWQCHIVLNILKNKIIKEIEKVGE